jgi:RimJ/RimL family protein N-acetyltransferase
MTTTALRLPARIVTDRLVLATPTAADIPAIARHCNNRNTHKWMARLPFPYSEEDARFFIEEIVPSDAEQCYGLMLDGGLIGVVGLTYSEDDLPELGYWLGEDFWGHGYATEAARAVIAAARAAGMTGLRSRALSENARSLNVLGKLGFIETSQGPETIGPNAGAAATFLRLDLSR